MKTKRHFQAVCYLLMLIFVQSLQGYICWECNARSETECDMEGKLVHCDMFNDICSTEVRKSSGHYQILKQCKQRQACLNERKQNWINDHESGECHNGQDTSVCRCCCFNEYCNRNEYCRPELTSTCRKLPNTFPFGEISCSSSNNVGSVCSFKCTEDNKVLFPSFSKEITCLPDGKWSQPIPCCSDPCPPSVRADIISLIHFNNEKDTTNFVERAMKPFLNMLKLGPNNLQMAIFQYDEVVHHPIILLNESSTLPQDEAVARILNGIRFRGTGNLPANTGNAMKYVFENIIGKEGDRRDATNILFINTSSNSDDEVGEASKDLTDAGTLVYYVFIETGSEKANSTQVSEVISFEGHQSVWSGDELYERFNEPVGEFLYHLCKFACPPIV